VLVDAGGDAIHPPPPKIRAAEWCAATAVTGRDGEAAKATDPELLAEPACILCDQVAGMRDHPAHQHFYRFHAIVATSVGADRPDLEAAVRRAR
jgi:hypothetical protein